EILRISPVAMLTFPKVAQKTVEILGYSIVPKTLVMVRIYLTLQHKDLYADIRKFRRECFLEREYFSDKCVPFEGGVCCRLEEAFAQFETRLVLRHYCL
ncbi:MAG: cytochrome P450, partial [cyanobacterium endosymbiont of Rhopalodia yunnanensis]